MTQPSLEDYRVELDAYAGPLDLLLYLVKRHEIDLNDIPIAKLAEQYLEHLKVLEQIDFDLAGEFLVMAATLLEIKSQVLVPPAEEEAPAQDQPIPTDANPLDPRYELVKQLLAYKRFKDAANELDARREEWESRFARVPPSASFGGSRTADLSSSSEETLDGNTDAAPVEIDLEDVHVLDLCAAFARILESIGHNKSHQVTYDDTPIALHAEDIVDRLGRDGAMTLQAIFVGRKTRGEMIGLFLAMLELVRQKRVKVVQDKAGGDIRLELRPESEQRPEDDTPADWRDPKTGEVQYEWPSEEARLAAQRRAKLRAEAIKRRLAGESVPEEEIIDVDEEPTEFDAAADEATTESAETDDTDAAV